MNTASILIGLEVCKTTHCSRRNQSLIPEQSCACLNEVCLSDIKEKWKPVCGRNTEMMKIECLSTESGRVLSSVDSRYSHSPGGLPLN